MLKYNINFEIKQNRKAIPCPIIDVISDDTFEYLTGSEMTYGGFDNHFIFDWIPVPERENVRRNQDRSLPLRLVNFILYYFIFFIFKDHLFFTLLK